MDATKIKFISSLILLCLFCFGCTKEVQYVDRPVIVEVPIAKELQFERPEKPIYYIKELTDTSNPKEVAEAYVNTIIQLNTYIDKLEVLVEPFYKN